MKKGMTSFLFIWIGQAFSLLGSSLVGFALMWWLTKSTGSAAVLATLAAIETLPRVFIGPFVGALVDRWNRQRIIIISDSVVALATVGLLGLTWAGLLQPWHIYVLTFVRAVGGSFHWSAMQASTSLLVPNEQLARVQGMNQVLNSAMGIAGPPLGALLVSLLPLHNILMIDIVTALLAIVPLFIIHIPQPEPTASAAQEKPSLGQDMKAGLRYIWNWPGLRLVVIVALIINITFTPAIYLLPVFVLKRLDGAEMAIASMQSFWAVGLLLGGVLLSVWGGFRSKIITSVLGLSGAAVGMLLVGFAPGLTWALVGIFIAGLTNILMNAPLTAILQAVVSPDMQGRVFMLVMSLSAAMTPLSLAVAGPLSDRVGVEWWFIIAGVTSGLSCLLILVVPALRNIEDGPPCAQEVVSTLVA